MNKSKFIISVFLFLILQSCSKQMDKIKVKRLTYYYQGDKVFLVSTGQKKLIVKKLKIIMPFNWKMLSSFKIKFFYALENQHMMILSDPVYFSKVTKDIYEGSQEASSQSILFNAKKNILKINSLRTFDDFRILPPWGIGMDETIIKKKKERDEIKSLPSMGYLYTGEIEKYIDNKTFDSQWIQLKIKEDR